LFSSSFIDSIFPTQFVKFYIQREKVLILYAAVEKELNNLQKAMVFVEYKVATSIAMLLDITCHKSFKPNRQIQSLGVGSLVKV
jgi:hypothetical protein